MCGEGGYGNNSSSQEIERTTSPFIVSPNQSHFSMGLCRVPICQIVFFFFSFQQNEMARVTLLKKQDSGDCCNLLNCLGPYHFGRNAVVCRISSRYVLSRLFVLCVWTDFSPPGSPLSMLFPPRDCFAEVDPLAVWDWSTAWVEEMEAQFRASTETSQNTRAEPPHKHTSPRWSLALLQFFSTLEA